MPITFLDEEEDIVTATKPPRVKGRITFLDEEEEPIAPVVEPETPSASEPPTRITFLDEEPEPPTIGGLAIPPAPEVTKFEATKPKESFLRPIADPLLNIGAGINDVLKGFTDAFGADNAVSQNLAKNSEFYRDLLSAGAKQDSEEIGRIMQEAEGQGLLAEIGAGLKALSVAPVDLVSQGIGSLIPFIATAGVGKAVGLSRGGIAILQGVQGGAVGGGIVKGEIYSAVKDQLINSGVDEAKAEKAAQEAQAYNGKNLDQILLGIGLGVAASTTGADSAIRSLISRKVGKQTAEQVSEQAIQEVLRTGFVRGALKDGTMEFVTEGLQGGQERLAANIAVGREGFDVEPMRGVVGQATLEGAIGSVLGGGAGGISARVAQRDAREVVALRDAQKAADEAKQNNAPASAAAIEEQVNQTIQETPDEKVARLQREAQEGVGIDLEEEVPVSGLPPERIKSARWFESAARNRLKELQDKDDAGVEDFTTQERDEFEFLKASPTPEQIAERYGYQVRRDVTPTTVTPAEPAAAPTPAESLLTRKSELDAEAKRLGADNISSFNLMYATRESLTEEQRNLLNQYGEYNKQVVELGWRDAAKLDDADFGRWEKIKLTTKPVSDQELTDLGKLYLAFNERGETQKAESVLKSIQSGKRKTNNTIDDWFKATDETLSQQEIDTINRENQEWNDSVDSMNEILGRKTPPEEISPTDIAPTLTPTPAAGVAGTTASVPVMITRKMEADLLSRGLTQEQINAMTPQEANDMLAQPAPTAAPVTPTLSTLESYDQIQTKQRDAREKFDQYAEEQRALGATEEQINEAREKQLNPALEKMDSDWRSATEAAATEWADSVDPFDLPALPDKFGLGEAKIFGEKLLQRLARDLGVTEDNSVKINVTAPNGLKGTLNISIDSDGNVRGVAGYEGGGAGKIEGFGLINFVSTGFSLATNESVRSRNEPVRLERPSKIQAPAAVTPTPVTPTPVTPEVSPEAVQAAEQKATQDFAQDLYGQEPYINHLRRVSEQMPNDKLKTAAFIHDSVEDGKMTLDEVRSQFGDDVAELVDVVSRKEGETYAQFIDRIAQNPEAAQIKLADLRENIRNVEDFKPSLRSRYEKAIAVLEPVVAQVVPTPEVPTVLDINPAQLAAQKETPFGTVDPQTQAIDSTGRIVPRYMWHSPPSGLKQDQGVVAYVSREEGAQRAIDESFGSKDVKTVWLGRFGRDKGMRQGAFTVDLAKLDPANIMYTGQAEGNVWYRGDIPESAIDRTGTVPAPQPEARESRRAIVTPQQDRDYLDAVERGDGGTDNLSVLLRASKAEDRPSVYQQWAERNPRTAETTQKAVEDTARRVGAIEVYHGGIMDWKIAETGVGDAVFFTEQKELAQRAADMRGNFGLRSGENRGVRKFFISKENILDATADDAAYQLALRNDPPIRKKNGRGSVT
jgi:hypothetical protein